MSDTESVTQAARLEKIMGMAEQPLVEAVNFLSDCCRLRTWQILNQQVFLSISDPRLAIETSQAGNIFTIYYWTDSHVLTFDALLEDPAAAKEDEPGKAETEPRAKLPPPHITLISHNQGISRVQIKHKPPLAEADGKIVQLTLNKEDVSLEHLIHQAISHHAKCRLRVLYKSLQAKTQILAAAGITSHLEPACHELEIRVDTCRRLSITVDTRMGDFAVRDVVRAVPFPLAESDESGNKRRVTVCVCVCKCADTCTYMLIACST
jgi:hypothetical protein